MNRSEIERLLLHTEQVEGCAYGGLGCLGEHDEPDPDYDYDLDGEGDLLAGRYNPPCLPVMIAHTTCLCGADDAYGEMHHAERCPLYVPS